MQRYGAMEVGPGTAHIAKARVSVQFLSRGMHLCKRMRPKLQ